MVRKKGWWCCGDGDSFESDVIIIGGRGVVMVRREEANESRDWLLTLVWSRQRQSSWRLRRRLATWQRTGASARVGECSRITTLLQIEEKWKK